MCPRVDSASIKMSTKKTPGGKDGRCVRVTTLPPSQCRKSGDSRSLNLPGPQKGLLRPVAGKLYLFYLRIRRRGQVQRRRFRGCYCHHCQSRFTHAYIEDGRITSSFRYTCITTHASHPTRHQVSYSTA